MPTLGDCAQPFLGLIPTSSPLHPAQSGGKGWERTRQAQGCKPRQEVWAMVLPLGWQSPSGALRRSILALAQLCTVLLV